jgi:hypothetical protein
MVGYIRGGFEMFLDAAPGVGRGAAGRVGWRDPIDVEDEVDVW